jgi:hypothetical protein
MGLCLPCSCSRSQCFFDLVYLAAVMRELLCLSEKSAGVGTVVVVIAVGGDT